MAKENKNEKSKSEPTKGPSVKAPAAQEAKVETVGGKFVVSVGEGGCRGRGWNSAPYPLDQGRLTPAQCAQACLQRGCSAFHLLNAAGDTAECFLFGHQDSASKIPSECS